MLCPTGVQYRWQPINKGPRRYRRGPDDNNTPIRALGVLDRKLSLRAYMFELRPDQGGLDLADANSCGGLQNSVRRADAQPPPQFLKV